LPTAIIANIAGKNEAEFLTWLRKFGADKFLLGADVKNERIVVSGWQETTELWVYDFIRKYVEQGISRIFCTDVSKDGKLEGPAVDLYKNIVSKFPEMFFIASGGVSSTKDLEDLRNAGCKGAIVGKAIYENRVSLRELAALSNES